MHSKFKLSTLLLVSFLFLAGCGSTTTIAPDLLVSPKYSKAVVKNSLTVKSIVNPKLNRYALVEESVKETVETALAHSNMFGKDTSHPYKLIITTPYFSQAQMSFKTFGNKLRVNYKLYNADNKLIVDESIYTIAGSDEYFFSGEKRSRRARAVRE